MVSVGVEGNERLVGGERGPEIMIDTYRIVIEYF